MMSSAWKQDLVLLGGGHSHALALRMLAMRPDPRIRITLISLDSHTPYSGMLPGLVAGHYRWDETHIDLRKLCSRAGIRFITARATAIDPVANQLHLAGRPPLSFDVLSVDIGSQPGLSGVPGASEFAIAVKPVHSFYQRWERLEERLSREQTLQIVLVGGGAGSLELALAMQHRAGSRLAVKLICGAGLLDGYNPRVRNAVRRDCARLGIELLEQSRVVAVDEKSLTTSDGTSHVFDEVFWCTGAVAEAWLRDTGLPCDEAGFLQVSDSLQVLGFPHIFAAGDIATQVNHPRPKAGVYAVRQAPVLAHNLAAFLNGTPLRQHHPQRRFLSLLSLGGKFAVADRGWLSARGAWVWRWKDRIDQRFMALFEQTFPDMPAVPGDAGEAMHCGGCGAKLPGRLLRESLLQLAREYPDCIDGQQLGDDAALLNLTPGKRLAQSVDVLRGLVDDPWLMGRIAALHALSDLYAMGATPHSALTNLTLPYAGWQLQQRDLMQLMSGAAAEMQRAQCRLLGGHTLEGPELAMGFTVNGELGETLLEKTGVQEGDQLILCKPLGTGVLFAAQQQGQADGRWIDCAIETMLLSNAASATLALDAGVTGATDVTGFGLLGHLAEMLAGGGVQARLELGMVPLLPGVRDCYDAGIQSTAQAGNIALALPAVSLQEGVSFEQAQALFDPQTCGGLLFAIAKDGVADLVNALQNAGYSQAARIGQVVTLPAEAAPIQILP